jgi:protein-S-isoprenylcysteine O-methyltransferase Ste14
MNSVMTGTGVTMVALLFYGGTAAIFLIAAIELSPGRFKNTQQHRKIDRGSGFLVTLTSVLVGVCAFWDVGLHGPHLAFVSESVGFLLVLMGFGLRVYSARVLGKNFNYSVAPLREPLYQKGLYENIRHPAYLGTILYSFGIALFFFSAPAFFFASLVCISVLYRMGVEERFLNDTLGLPYRSYREKTWRLLPFIF